MAAQTEVLHCYGVGIIRSPKVGNGRGDFFLINLIREGQRMHRGLPLFEKHAVTAAANGAVLEVFRGKFRSKGRQGAE
jgi:hypothetical protein